MDELVKLVMEKGNMGEAQAKQAVDTVVGFLKTKLPAPIAGQIDGVLANEAVMGQAAGVLEKGASALGGLLKKR